MDSIDRLDIGEPKIFHRIRSANYLKKKTQFFSTHYKVSLIAIRTVRHQFQEFL